MAIVLLLTRDSHVIYMAFQLDAHARTQHFIESSGICMAKLVMWLDRLQAAASIRTE